MTKPLWEPKYIYMDGSGIEGRIGAAAVLYIGRRNPKVLRYHLGMQNKHTVYKAEAVDLSLAMHLLNSELDLTTPVDIYVYVDNQAMIKCGEVFTTKSDHYLMDHFARLIKQVWRTHNLQKTDIKLHWIASHKEVTGNKKVNEEAKVAAKNNLSPPERLLLFLHNGPLSHSISNLNKHRKTKKKECWTRIWSKSPHYIHLSSLDPKLLSGSWIVLMEKLNRKQTSHLIWLCTKHCPLNDYLHQIKRVDMVNCIKYIQWQDRKHQTLPPRVPQLYICMYVWKIHTNQHSAQKSHGHTLSSLQSPGHPPPNGLHQCYWMLQMPAPNHSQLTGNSCLHHAHSTNETQSRIALRDQLEEEMGAAPPISLVLTSLTD